MAKHGDVAAGPGWELRCGDYREVLADVTECDAVITDPPYSAGTHAGSEGLPEERRDIDYSHWDSADVQRFVGSWHHRCRGWIAAMTSHDLALDYQAHYRQVGRYPFAPVVIKQHRPRIVGDGPGSCAVYMMVARPRNRSFATWGALPGWYNAGVERNGVIGGKPLPLMRAIVQDYSRPGDLIVDPCAGGGTTLLAAVIEGRRAIGAELDPETFDKAVQRLRNGFTPNMFARPAPAPSGKQAGLFDDSEAA